MNRAKVQTDIRAKSISDDDLCEQCANCHYCPGELSLCKLVSPYGAWPGLVDHDNYVISCADFKPKTIPRMAYNLRRICRYG